MKENNKFKIKNYLFTPKDFFDMFKKMGQRDIIGIIILIIISFILRLFFDFKMESIIFWSFFISLFWWKLDSRISIGLALACLCTCPILLILFNKNILLLGDIWAEQMAVWTYYFLVIGVVKQIYELKSTTPHPKKIKKKLNKLSNLPKSKSFDSLKNN